MNPAPGLGFTPDQIDRVIFFKRDEITADLICCEVSVSGSVLFFHEECVQWRALLRSFDELKAFDGNWFEKVAKPPFQTCETVAFTRL
ncbi:MAG: hypothetical protein ACOVKV_13965 [Novosphingobium sp.]